MLNESKYSMPLVRCSFGNVLPLHLSPHQHRSHDQSVSPVVARPLPGLLKKQDNEKQLAVDQQPA